jgi:phage tail sheath protein FI
VPEYLAPAVYVEEVSFRAPSIEGVGTTTTGFAGLTLTGPVGGVPQLLTSFGDFQAIYGGFDQLSLTLGNGQQLTTNYLALSVMGFFDNGGSELYVSRVFSQASTTDTGNASASLGSGSTAITVNARFPGSFANNQVVSASLVATKTAMANLAALPWGSVVALVSPGSAAMATLAQPAQATDTQITIAPALSGSTPPSVLVDNEILTVTAADPTKTVLTVTRAQGGTTAAAHGAGVAVFAPIGVLSGAITPGPTAMDITLAAELSGFTPTNQWFPASVRLDNETIAVTGVDSTGKILTLATAAAQSHAANDPVFAPIGIYTNGTSNAFTSGAVTLNGLPPGSNPYVLTMNVSSYGAASSKPTVPTPQSTLTYSGLGFDSHHPNYIGSTLGATPPRAIDALQNQVAFSFASGVTALSLLSTLFGSWGGPGANSTQSFTLLNGDDGVEPQAVDFRNALACLTGLEDIAIVAAPGSSALEPANAQAIIDELITHVSQQRAYRIAILDTPLGFGDSDYENVRAQIDSSYAALYVPWIQIANPLAKSGTSIPTQVYVPPSGFMAGIYARSDDQTSVAKAPANEVVLDALDFERRITFGEQALLNPLGINCLRYFPDRGFRVWGARTVSSDTEFMYVNVRRYLIYLEHSIDISTQWAVFENNGPALWARVKDAIDSFLNAEFVAGNLLGTSPAQAYFVRCDRTTMTQNDLDNGRMICLIGVSVLKPAEFVIFRIGQWTASAQS